MFFPHHVFAFLQTVFGDIKKYRLPFTNFQLKICNFSKIWHGNPLLYIFIFTAYYKVVCWKPNWNWSSCLGTNIIQNNYLKGFFFIVPKCLSQLQIWLTKTLNFNEISSQVSQGIGCSYSTQGLAEQPHPSPFSKIILCFLIE